MNAVVDIQTVFNGLMVIVSVVGPFVLRTVFDRIKDAGVRAERAEANLAEFKTHVSDYYLSIRRFEGFEERLFSELKAIRESLAEKADKGGR